MNGKQLIGTIIDTTLRIVFIVAAVMLIYKYAMTAYDFGYRVFAEEPVSSAENARTISISFDANATTMEIGEALEENGLIQDAKLFYVQEFLSGYHGELQPGLYELSSSMTAEEMMAAMAAKGKEDQEGSQAEEQTEEETVPGEEAEGENLDTGEKEEGDNGGEADEP